MNYLRIVITNKKKTCGKAISTFSSYIRCITRNYDRVDYVFDSYRTLSPIRVQKLDSGNVIDIAYISKDVPLSVQLSSFWAVQLSSFWGSSKNTLNLIASLTQTPCSTNHTFFCDVKDKISFNCISVQVNHSQLNYLLVEEADFRMQIDSKYACLCKFTIVLVSADTDLMGLALFHWTTFD